MIRGRLSQGQRIGRIEGQFPFMMALVLSVSLQFTPLGISCHFYIVPDSRPSLQVAHVVLMGQVQALTKDIQVRAVVVVV